MEELPARGIRSRIDQDPDVHVASGDDSVERRVNLLERLELLEPADVRDIRIHGGLHRAERAHGLVGLLLGDRVGLEERLPAVRSEEHTSELQSLTNLVCRLLLEKKK